MNRIFKSNPLVLLHETEPDIIIILHKCIREAIDDNRGNHEICIVNSSNAALAQACLRFVPLLLITHSPKQYGGIVAIELTKSIKDLSPATHVIMTTVDESDSLVIEARRAGVDTFFLKPFSLEHVQLAIQNALHLSDDGTTASKQ